MSKRHQASRRKSYGRRQHELHERIDRTRRREPTSIEVFDTDAFDDCALDPRRVHRRRRPHPPRPRD